MVLAVVEEIWTVGSGVTISTGVIVILTGSGVVVVLVLGI